LRAGKTYSSFIDSTACAEVNKGWTMNTQVMMSKVIGVAGAAVMSVAFVSLFAAMGAGATAQAKSDAAYAALTVVKVERIDVVGKAERNSAVNTRGVTAAKTL
jgi:hypothetical protein